MSTPAMGGQVVSSLGQDKRAILDSILDHDFVPHLPPLLDSTKSPEAQKQKNRSRAFSAFALHHICRVSKIDAARAVIDDFDDFGIDAIYYDAKSETLCLVQAKLKDAAQFSQEEALAYCQGIRKLIKQDFSGFNKNLQDRQTEIEDALDNCSYIQLMLAHTGAGISKHAELALQELLNDEDHGEARLVPDVIHYNAVRVIQDIRALKSYPRVDTEMWIQRCSCVSEPHVTYLGLVQLSDLIELHEKHGEALYEKNIRTFLGNRTEVNTSIQRTLAENPHQFFYLNNGVTALCNEIFPKGTKPSKGGRKRLKLHGFSVINGAQTIAASAQYAKDKKNDISQATVSLTIIKTPSDNDFGKAVTRARNHQNPVLLSNFAALDDEQERLRCELAHLGIHYEYKASAYSANADVIRIDEATQALALTTNDPRFAVWLKKEPSRFLDTTAAQYKLLFAPSLTAFHLINAVRFNRYVQHRIFSESCRASGQERLTYRHGNYALAWILAKRLRKSIVAPAALEETKLAIALSVPFDELRQMCWNKTRDALAFKGPLALFRSQMDALPVMANIMIENFGVASDPVVESKKKTQKAGQPYPVELFDYLLFKAPQIAIT
jgi:hypothetical protein